MKKKVNAGKVFLIAAAVVCILLYVRAALISWNEKEERSPEYVRTFFEEKVRYKDEETENSEETGDEEHEGEETESESLDALERMAKNFVEEAERIESITFSPGKSGDDLTIYLHEEYTDGWKNGNGDAKREDLRETAREMFDALNISITELVPIEGEMVEAEVTYLGESDYPDQEFEYTYCDNFGYAAMCAKMFGDDKKTLYRNMVSAYKDPENNYYRYEFTYVSAFAPERVIVIVDGINCFCYYAEDEEQMQKYVDLCKEKGIWK